MRFRVQNLGPLRDAEVDLSKDLIVLAGPNNAGETYLAWSVYALHSQKNEVSSSTLLEPWASRLIDTPEHSVSTDEVLAGVGSALSEEIAARCRTSLHLCFATATASFAAAKLTLSSIALSEGVSSFVHIFSFVGPQLSALRVAVSGRQRQAEWALGSVDMIPSFTALGHDSPDAAERRSTTMSGVIALKEEHRRTLQQQLSRTLYNGLVARLLPRCTIFPAERIAVNIFAKELALKRTELVDELVDADLTAQDGALDLVRRKAGRYPWPIRDSLRVANDLTNLGKELGPFASLADELETAVLGGRMSVADTGELLFSPSNAADQHLPMHLTASVVKSLSSLVFYFRHLARRGDLLIIDEPELNLHPDNQRKVTRILAKAVRQGFKIMMSTHSDYVLRELNHMVMLSKLPEEEARTLGYDPAWALRPEQLGVYLFDDGRAEPVEVGETGFSIRTIDAVVNQLNADEQRLYARLDE